MAKDIYLSKDRLKDWLRFRYEQATIPGFVVAIAQNGKLLFSEAYGFANLEKKEKLTTDHIFRIASHSKTFTATALMQLQEEGKLRIDDHVAKHLTWLKDHKDQRWADVTLRQLMSHGAGVIRDGEDSDYWQLYRAFPNKDQFKKEIFETDLVIANNLKLKYSNYGYTLLGLVIEAVTGQDYNDYVSEKIIQPLGLSSTGPELEDKITDRLVTGYSAELNKQRLPIAQIDTKAMSPATGFYSTAADLCAYFSAHLIGTDKLLSDDSKKEMQKVAWRGENLDEREDYGLGLEIAYLNHKPIIGHGGGFPGHITQSFFDPDTGVAVVALTNGMRSNPDAICKGILGMVKKLNNAKEPTPEFKKYEGRFLSLWSSIEIIASGNKLYGCSANQWSLMDRADELKHLHDHTFKIAKTDSFSSVDELVHFKFGNSGQVESVRYGGETLLPEEAYIKNLKTKTQIDE